MDSILTPSKRRFIPLVRILERLGVKVMRKEGQVSFTFGPGGHTVIDTERGMMERGGKSAPLKMIVTVSEMTQRQDVFILPASVSGILDIPLAWDEANYEVSGKTGRTLAIWKIRKRASLLGVPTEDTGPKLPEVHGEAIPKKDGVHFMRLDARGTYRLQSKKDRSATHSGTLGGVTQTIWGSLAQGGYKVRLSEPSYVMDKYGGLFRDGQDAVKMDWLQWSRRFANAELAVGDSVFGLNDINMPSIRMTGVRVNGFTGRSDPARSRKRGYGLRPYFLQPHVFEGQARAGSTVELFINDRRIDTLEVLPDSPTKPGFGSYVFEDINLTPGVLNEIRIVITDPDGLTSTLEKEIMGSAVLLTQGETAFLGAAGTRRRSTRFEADGGMAVGRVLHGLTPNVTLGGSLAVHKDFWGEYLERRYVRDGRSYPKSGINGGAQVSWLAMDKVLLSGDMAASAGRDEDGQGPEDQYNDLALKFKADICPIRNVTIRSQIFSFGTDFFDGVNPDLRDRRGATITSGWRISRKWRARFSAGTIWNNLDGSQSETLRTNYQGLAVSTSAIPRTSVSLEANRLDQSWAENPLTIYRVRVRATPFRNLTLMADASSGDALSMGDYSDFLSGLQLPGITTGRQPTVALTARKTISDRQSVGVSYRGDETETRHSVFHSYRTTGKRSVQLRTEVGWDIDHRSNRGDAFFENRCELLTDRTGRNRIGLQTRYQREEWTAIAYVNLSNLFAFDGMRPRRVTNWRVNPDRGAIHGTVFVDYNANATRDKGEPGVKEIKVRMSTVAEDITDERGRFLLSTVGRDRTVRVSLEMDTVPADYSVVHGTQMVCVMPNRLTRVDFALTPFIAITGKVLYVNGAAPKPIVGVRVFLVDSKTGEIVVDSVTAGDGSYYLGGVKPGGFVLKVDTKTLPSQYGLIETQRDVTVTPKKEFSEVTLPPFIAKSFPTGEIETMERAWKTDKTLLEVLFDSYFSRSDLLGIQIERDYERPSGR